jgi:hypothetical protein
MIDAGNLRHLLADFMPHLTSCRHTRLDSWRLKQKSRRGIRAPRRLVVDNLPYPIPRESSVGSSITAVVVSPCSDW